MAHEHVDLRLERPHLLLLGDRENGELLRQVQSRPYPKTLGKGERLQREQEDILRNIVEREVALQHKVLTKMKEFAKLGYDIGDEAVFKQVLAGGQNDQIRVM